MTEPRTKAGKALLALQATAERGQLMAMFRVTEADILAIEAEAAAPSPVTAGAEGAGLREALDTTRRQLHELVMDAENALEYLDHALVQPEAAGELDVAETISLERLADHIADVCGSTSRPDANWDGAARGLEFLLFADGYSITRTRPAPQAPADSLGREK